MHAGKRVCFLLCCRARGRLAEVPESRYGICNPPRRVSIKGPVHMHVVYGPGVVRSAPRTRDERS